jgi:transposase
VPGAVSGGISGCHKRTHTVATVFAGSGQLAGERVVRVPPKLMGESRRAERSAGKSDPIDALAVARAALREGPESLPEAHLDEGALQLKLLLGHRADLVGARSLP